MNDTDLDDMLNQWDAPPAPRSIRERVRAGFAAMGGQRRKHRFAWPSWHMGKGLFAGAAAAALVFVAVLAQAYPQSFGLGGPSPVLGYPYFVISNVVAYAPDGTSRIDANIVSFSYKGTELVITENHPDNPFQEFFKNFHNGMHFFLLRYVPGLVMPESAAKDAWFSSYVQAGCVDKGDTVVGHEAILKHATTAIQQNYPDGWRWTAWRAPDLGCFTLRSRTEEPLPGGGFRLTKQRDAVSVAHRTGHPWELEK